MFLGFRSIETMPQGCHVTHTWTLNLFVLPKFMNDPSINPYWRGLSRSLPLTANTITKHGLQFPIRKAFPAFGQGRITAATQLALTLSWAFPSLSFKAICNSALHLSSLKDKHSATYIRCRSEMRTLSLGSKNLQRGVTGSGSKMVTTLANGLSGPLRF